MDCEEHGLFGLSFISGGWQFIEMNAALPSPHTLRDSLCSIPPLVKDLGVGDVGFSAKPFSLEECFGIWIYFNEHIFSFIDLSIKVFCILLPLIKDTALDLNE